MKSPSASIRVPVVLAVLLAGGCANMSAPMPSPPEVPAALRPPEGQVLFLEALASGVQVYECAAKAGQAGAFEWAFRAPEATLADSGGRPLGKHFAGPTWQHTDGSAVVAEAKARDPGPDPTAIPWLLLTAKSSSGDGVFKPTRSVQRLKTTGGPAPAQPCGAANAGQVARVPYTASYYFYR